MKNRTSLGYVINEETAYFTAVPTLLSYDLVSDQFSVDMLLLSIFLDINKLHIESACLEHIKIINCTLHIQRWRLNIPRTQLYFLTIYFWLGLLKYKYGYSCGESSLFKVETQKTNRKRKYRKLTFQRKCVKQSKVLLEKKTWNTGFCYWKVS